MWIVLRRVSLYNQIKDDGLNLLAFPWERNFFSRSYKHAAKSLIWTAIDSSKIQAGSKHDRSLEDSNLKPTKTVSLTDSNIRRVSVFARLFMRYRPFSWYKDYQGCYDIATLGINVCFATVCLKVNLCFHRYKSLVTLSLYLTLRITGPLCWQDSSCCIRGEAPPS
jgi:hypothetical protein